MAMERMSAGAVAAAAHKVTIGAGGTAVIAGLTANEAAALIGASVAVLGLLVNAYYKHKDEVRKAELHRARVQAAQFRPYEDQADE